MIQTKKMTLNPFAENTYLVWDESGECAVIDPGCSTPEEEKLLSTFIREHHLKPVLLLNTHCHIDHVFGNRFVAETYGLELTIPKGEEGVLASAPQLGQMFGVTCAPSPEAGQVLVEGDVVRFGNSELKVISTPGHSPASVCFYSEEDRLMISGDVLFLGSIGRTDLPGGSYEVLMASIRDKLLPLGDDLRILPGHGPATTIGAERAGNPFLQDLK